MRTNFHMPDVYSFGLGGGSIVESGPESIDSITVGPLSVGYELTAKACVFGGEVLTATDIAVAAGRVELGDKHRIADVAPALVDGALASIHERVHETAHRASPDRMVPF